MEELRINDRDTSGLRRGGQGMPRGYPGSGRPKSEVVDACKQAFDKSIPLLEKFADDEKLDVKRRLEAINLIGKYGIGTIVRHEITNEQILYVFAQIATELMPSKANEFVTQARLALSLGSFGFNLPSGPCCSDRRCRPSLKGALANGSTSDACCRRDSSRVLRADQTWPASYRLFPPRATELPISTRTLLVEHILVSRLQLGASLTPTVQSETESR